ncbi:MAG: DUF4382 domain-containing protein [Bacteroidota bacterium]
MKKFSALLLPLLLISAVFSACSDDDGTTPATKATLSVSLTDAPADYDEVNITFSEIAISMNGGWVVLNGNPMTVNLLEWNNGKSIELGRQDFDPGKVTQIRLMVTHAELVKDGQTYQITIPSAEQTGLKIVTNFDLVAGSTYELVLDFDANQSIVTTGNPSNPTGYKLKPTIRAVDKAVTGSISGTVSNFEHTPLAIVLQGGVEITSTPVDRTNGSFRLSYLLPGVYNVRFEDSMGLLFTALEITVVAGQDQAIGTVTLQ